MTYRYIYDPVALQEYKDAVEWYQERSELAASNFVFELREKIAIICGDPLRFRNTYKTYRETALKKFPYTIVYFVDEESDLIIIASVFHNKRNPIRKYRK